MKHRDTSGPMRGFVPLPNRLMAEAECAQDFAIYAALASWRDWSTGISEIGAQKISDLAHVSKPTVLTRLAWLQARGFIEVVHNDRHSQRRAYRLPDVTETGKPENRSTPKPVLTITGQYQIPEPVNTETETGKGENHVLRSKKKNVGTRIPADFRVTDEHRQFAREKGLPDPDSEFEAFRDYWVSKPGQNAVKLDWNATFRGWLRNARNYGPRFPRESAPSSPRILPARRATEATGTLL